MTSLPCPSFPVVRDEQYAVRHSDPSSGGVTVAVENAAEQNVIEFNFEHLTTSQQADLLTIWDSGAWQVTPITLTPPGYSTARQVILLGPSLDIRHDGPRKKSGRVRVLDVTPPGS